MSATRALSTPLCESRFISSDHGSLKIQRLQIARVEEEIKKTLIHELGHALLYAEGPVASREVAEVEVESVAYIVCDALGLDSGDYSLVSVVLRSKFMPEPTTRLLLTSADQNEGLGQAGEGKR